MAKAPKREWYEDMFETVGAIVYFTGGIAGVLCLLYLLLLAPYERHKEVLNKLETLQYSLSQHEAYNANMHLRKD